MTRPNSEVLTEREARIMGVLWGLGKATARQVRERLPDHPHDSTVRTLLRVLESKGCVAHEREGRIFVYFARVERLEAQRSGIRSLLTRLFSDSPDALVLRLIEDGQMTPERWERIMLAHRSHQSG